MSESVRREEDKEEEEGKKDRKGEKEEERKNERNESHLWRKGERTKPTKDKTMYGGLEWTEWHVREAKPYICTHARVSHTCGC